MKLERADIEDFLYREAELLDRWQLDEWLALFTSDAHYLVPTPALAEASTAEDALYYIADDRARLEARIWRLSKPTAHVEHPRSETRHVVNNVRIAKNSNGEVETSAVFTVYRYTRFSVNTYTGRMFHTLIVSSSGDIRIREKRCVLDGDKLRQGTISIIL